MDRIISLALSRMARCSMTDSRSESSATLREVMSSKFQIDPSLGRAGSMARPVMRIQMGSPLRRRWTISEMKVSPRPMTS